MAEVSARILVVEDDRAVRDAIERALDFEGYEVTTARDGAEALQRVLNESPDLVVLDVMMPIVDGLETWRGWRAPGPRGP